MATAKFGKSSGFQKCPVCGLTKREIIEKGKCSEGNRCPFNKVIKENKHKITWAEAVNYFSEFGEEKKYDVMFGNQATYNVQFGEKAGYFVESGKNKTKETVFEEKKKKKYRLKCIILLFIILVILAIILYFFLDWKFY